ncbi:rCG22666, isoform CRA_a, partial [Rattus norvegicus]
MQLPWTSLGQQETHLSPHLDKCFTFGALLACLVKG